LLDVDTLYYQSEYIVYVYDEEGRTAHFQMDALLYWLVDDEMGRIIEEVGNGVDAYEVVDDDEVEPLTVLDDDV
jgi:hypothetical protein